MSGVATTACVVCSVLWRLCMPVRVGEVRAHRVRAAAANERAEPSRVRPHNDATLCLGLATVGLPRMSAANTQ